MTDANDPASFILNQAPVAVTDHVNVVQGESVTFDVLSNDTDVDGDELSVVSAVATQGSVSVGTDGSLTYTPNANFYGSDVITYTIEDSYGNPPVEGTVNVTVEQYVNVITVTHAKGSGGGSMEYIVAMLLLLALLQRQFQWAPQQWVQKRACRQFALLAGVLLMSFNMQAADDNSSDEGWFIGGQFGTASTYVSRGELESIIVVMALS